ncbi:cytochrome c biogenesis protein CcdA [Catalinimonas sp. 4WD22]|jgi:thiol:disulfide interchange protein DsbD|uniref:protein-disulfide reductase DsbD family protein n=1 Tax=Catalinimonas locisalis TaxID=3133978 RepID=UPI003101AF1A
MFKKLILTALMLYMLIPVHAQSVFDTMNKWVGEELAASSGIGSYFFLLLGGVLASLLPCVYPVYPLTVNFLRGRQSSLGKFAHPLIYYIGLAAIYFLFGVLASLSGGMFNEVFRLPIANLLIGILLFIMALATVDLLHLPLFGGQVDSKQQGLAGSFLMGAGAGMLSSACVGPIVVSILLAIASSSTIVTLGMTLSAAFKMLLFGMGVGLPVLLLGVFGLGLPKSGKWMLYVQWIFALLIGYFALGYVVKALNIWGFEDTTATYLVLSALLFVWAIYKLQADSAMKQLRMQKSLFALAAVLGFFLMGSQMLVLPVSAGKAGNDAAIASTSSIEQKGALSWYLDKELAYQQAAQSGKLVFVDFHGDWCTNCKAFQKMTQEDKALNEALQNAVLYKVYDTSAEFEKYRNDERFPELKIGIPFFLITDAEGNVIYKTNDYTKTEEMMLFLESS